MFDNSDFTNIYGQTMLMYVNVGEQHRESGNEQFM